MGEVINFYKFFKQNQQQLFKLIKFSFLLIGLAFIVFQLKNLKLEYLKLLEIRVFLISTLFLFIGISLFSYYWGYLLKNVDSKVLLSTSMKNYFQGQLGKYIPGSIWSITGRIGLASESGLPLGEVTRITTNHLIHLWLNCLFLGLILYVEEMLLLVIFFLLLVSYSLYFKKPYFVYSTGWLFIGISYLILIANQEQLLIINDFKILSSSLLSWLGGFLFIPSPSGIGVREYLFTYIYSDINLYDQLFIIATLSRISSVIGDFFGVLFYTLYSQQKDKNK